MSILVLLLEAAGIHFLKNGDEAKRFAVSWGDLNH